MEMGGKNQGTENISRSRGKRRGEGKGVAGTSLWKFFARFANVDDKIWATYTHGCRLFFEFVSSSPLAHSIIHILLRLAPRRKLLKAIA